jgi:hypothetical protein
MATNTNLDTILSSLGLSGSDSLTNSYTSLLSALGMETLSSNQISAWASMLSALLGIKESDTNQELTEAQIASTEQDTENKRQLSIQDVASQALANSRTRGKSLMGYGFMNDTGGMSDQTYNDLVLATNNSFRGLPEESTQT